MEKSCLKANLQPKQLYSPVKTRFASVLIMLQRLFEYRVAVEICYGQSSNIGLKKRCPAVTEWRVVESVLCATKPIQDVCTANQGINHWLLSYAIYSTIQICLQLRYIINESKNGLSELADFSLEATLLKLKFSIAGASESYIFKFIPFASIFVKE